MTRFFILSQKWQKPTRTSNECVFNLHQSSPSRGGTCVSRRPPWWLSSHNHILQKACRIPTPSPRDMSGIPIAPSSWTASYLHEQVRVHGTSGYALLWCLSKFVSHVWSIIWILTLPSIAYVLFGALVGVASLSSETQIPWGGTRELAATVSLATSDSDAQNVPRRGYCLMGRPDRLYRRSTGTIFRISAKCWANYALAGSPKYPHRWSLHVAAYSPAKLEPGPTIRITDSTKCGPLTSTSGHKQHGPSIWCVAQYSSRSLGCIRACIVDGLRVLISVSMDRRAHNIAHHNHSFSRLVSGLYWSTECKEFFAFAWSPSKWLLIVYEGYRVDLGEFESAFLAFLYYRSPADPIPLQLNYTCHDLLFPILTMFSTDAIRNSCLRCPQSYTPWHIVPDLICFLQMPFAVRDYIAHDHNHVRYVLSDKSLYHNDAV